MKMIKLNESTYVASDTIAKVIINWGAGDIMVYMASGEGSLYAPKHGESIGSAADRLIAAIDRAEGGT